MIKASIYARLNLCPNYVFFNCIKDKPSVLLDDILDRLIEGKSGLEIAKFYNRSPQTFNRAIKKLFPKIKLKGGGETWSYWVISQSDHKKCGNCELFKLRDEFTTDNSKSDNIDSLCKECKSDKNKEWYNKNKEYHRNYLVNNRGNFNANTAKRRASIVNAIAPWADLEKIRVIYSNTPEGYHVDHVIPLQGKNICGLHVENNLQYLTVEENLKKGNKLL